MAYNGGLVMYEDAHQGYTLKPPPPTTRVPGRWRQIYWIGIGSKTTGLHSKKEFLKLVRYAHPEAVYWRRRGDNIVPEGKLKRNDIEGWIEIAGAKWV